MTLVLTSDDFLLTVEAPSTTPRAAARRASPTDRGPWSCTRWAYCCVCLERLVLFQHRCCFQKNQHRPGVILATARDGGERDQSRTIHSPGCWDDWPLQRSARRPRRARWPRRTGRAGRARRQARRLTTLDLLRRLVGHPSVSSEWSDHQSSP